MSAHSLERPFANYPETPSFDLRSIAATAGGMLAVGALATFTDQLLTNNRWPKSPTEVASEDESATCLVFGGLGQTGGDEVRRELSVAIAEPMASVRYSSRGISTRAVGSALVSYFRRDAWSGGEREQKLITHSMGLPVSLESMAWAIKARHRVPPVSEIHAISSPFRASDTYMEEALGYLRYINPRLAGVSGKFIVGCYYAMERSMEMAGGSKSLAPSNLARVVREASSGLFDQLPPKTWLSMAKLMGRTGRYTPGIFNGIITPDTRIFHYIDPKDDVVRPEASETISEKLCKPYGAQLHVVETPGAGHANTTHVAPLIAQNSRANIA